MYKSVTLSLTKNVKFDKLPKKPNTLTRFTYILVHALKFK